MNIFEITLDVDKHGNHESVNMRQGDLMGTTISATLRDHDVPMEGGDYDAFFCMTLPDRKTYYRTEADYADGVVSVVVDEQYAAQVPGSTNNAYFELWDGEELKYTTDSFVVRIKASAMDGKPAESYDSRVEEIMSEMREVIDEETVNEAARQEAEAAREAAESIRATTFETNEAAREATFTANEAERESTAAANEQARADLFTANEDERIETFSENEDERSQTFETNESDRASTFASNEAERIATFSDNEDERSDTFSENEQSREDTFTDNEATRAATFLANESQRSSTFTANEARREAVYNDIIQYPKAEVETTSAGQILHVTWKNEGGEYSTDLTVNDATSIVVTGDTFSVPVDHDGVCTTGGVARFYFSGWVGSKRVPCSASLTSGPDSRFRVQFTNATSTAEGVVRVTYTAGTTYDDLVDVCTFTLSCNGKSYVHRISATAPKAGKNAGFGTVSASVTNIGDTPSVEVTASGTDDAKNIDFAFSGIQGADGYSPSVSITDSDSSHTVTITDSTGDHSYTVPTYADEEQAREDAWDALESTVTDARDEALSAAALARNVNGNRLAKTLSGTILTADDAYAAPPIDAVIYGASTQDGTPTPSAPVPIESVDALTLHATTVPLERRNLLRKTGDFAAADIVRLRSTVPEPGIARIAPTTSSAFVKFKVDYLDFADYDEGTFTVSFDARLTPVESSYTENSLLVYLGFSRADRIGERLQGDYDCFAPARTFSLEPTSEWQRFSTTYNVPSDLTSGQASTLVAGSQMSVQFGENASNKPVDVRHVKLERGTVATDWTPAIEDADATGWPVSIGLQGYQLRSLPDGTRDELTLTPEGTAYRVTLTRRTGEVTLKDEFEQSDIGAHYNTGGARRWNVGSVTSDNVMRSKPCMCSTGLLWYNSDTYSGAGNRDHYFFGTNSGTLYVVAMVSEVTTAAMAQWMNDNLAGATLVYPLATEQTIDLGTVALPANPAPDMTAWADGGSAQPSLDATYERDANMAESAINADVDELHNDVTELRTDTDGLLANVAQIPSMLSQQLTAGAAGGITGGGPTDSAAWTERVTGGGDASDGPANIDAIRGRTVVWNQLVESIATRANDGITTSYDASTHLFSVRNDSRTSNYSSGSNRGAVVTSAHVVSGHKYLVGGTAPTGAIITVGTGASGYASRTIFTAPSSNSIYLRITSNYDFVSVHPVGDVTTFHLCIFDLTLMFGAGNEPSTVAEFEALFPESYYPYDAGSLLPVRMEGVESVGFNQWDEELEVGGINFTTGENVTATDRIRSTNYIPVFPSTEYYFHTGERGQTAWQLTVFCYGADKQYLGTYYYKRNATLTAASDCHYIRFITTSAYGTTYKHDICISLSGPRNGEYEPYWKSERSIPASTYFPDGMRSAGSVYDELTADAAVTRVGSVDLGTLNWIASTDATGQYFYTDSLTSQAILPNSTTVANFTCAKYQATSSSNVYDKSIAGSGASHRIYVRDTTYTDAATFKASLSGIMLHYALATPTTTPIDPPLNLTYRAAQGGTERITHTDPTAPPTLDITYGSTADGIRDRVLSAIAPVENGRASANYAVGSYLIHDGTLCKVTTAIASGEAIGTNVTATTVMAEVIALTQ